MGCSLTSLELRCPFGRPSIQFFPLPYVLQTPKATGRFLHCPNSRKSSLCEPASSRSTLSTRSLNVGRGDLDYAVLQANNQKTTKNKHAYICTYIHECIHSFIFRRLPSFRSLSLKPAASPQPNSRKGSEHRLGFRIERRTGCQGLRCVLGFRVLSSGQSYKTRLDVQEANAVHKLRGANHLFFCSGP